MQISIFQRQKTFTYISRPFWKRQISYRSYFSHSFSNCHRSRCDCWFNIHSTANLNWWCFQSRSEMSKKDYTRSCFFPWEPYNTMPYRLSRAIPLKGAIKGAGPMVISVLRPPRHKFTSFRRNSSPCFQRARHHNGPESQIYTPKTHPPSILRRGYMQIFLTLPPILSPGWWDEEIL